MKKMCRNCLYCSTLYKHPSNKRLKGQISEVAGFACRNPELFSKEQACFMEKDTGVCETFTPKYT